MTRVEVSTYTAQIYIGGSLALAHQACRDFCDAVGLCVTVEPVSYVFTDGATDGVRVGLINYGRFPADAATIFHRAEELATILIHDLDQETASIVASDKTVWLSRREQNA